MLITDENVYILSYAPGPDCLQEESRDVGHCTDLQNSPADAPWDLLLVADPERKQVEKYLYAGDCYAAVQGE
jgi:hypothetical protein